MEDRYDPVDIVVKQAEGIEIEFADGYRADLNLVDLRLGCPCATCRGLRDRGEESWPRPGSPTPLRIQDANLHGAWGIALTWNDGHSTGIYPFDALRRWAEGQRPFAPDSGLGE